MFGFVIGTICLVGLLRVVSRHRWHHAHMYGYGYGHGGCGGGHHHHRGWHGHAHGNPWGGNPWGGNPFDRDGRSDRSEQGNRDERSATDFRHGLFPILRRLDLTPAQEKVVFAAADDLRGKVKELRDAWLAGRKDIAETVRGPILTGEQATLLVARFDAPLDALRAAIADALAKIHEALDDRQRKELGDLLEAIGPRAFWF